VAVDVDVIFHNSFKFMEVLISGSNKTSITALRLHLEPVIYKNKLLDSKCFASLVLDAFLKPFEKYGVF
jgi:hypothetical protein